MRKGLARNQSEDFFRKNDNDTARQRQKSVRTLRRIVGFQGKTYLNDTKTEQDQTNRTDKTENEIGQVIDNGKRIACGESRCRHRKNSGQA